MRLNNSHSSFTLLELLIVIVIIGILASTLNFNFAPDNLQLASDNLIKNIRFTQSLALKDDKYQPFPIKDNAIENNRSKYWFKQWWHLKITNAGNDIIYYIFSDISTNTTANFDKKIISGTYQYELARNSENQYLIGISKDETGNSNYPNNIDKKLNLTKTYGIKRVEFDNYSASSMPNGLGKRVNILFDNYGNLFLKEGETGDGGDINPLDFSNRPILTKNAAIKLCLDNPCKYTSSHCIQINITPSGYIYKTQCD